jgi:hypothetical protein
MAPSKKLSETPCRHEDSRQTVSETRLPFGGDRMSGGTPKAAEPRTVFPQLELLTVSILPRPANTFWSALSTATKPMIRSGGIFRGRLLNGIVPTTAVTGRYNSQDHTIEVVARVEMLTDDGATIYKTDRGVWRGNADAIERLVNGESVAACEYYFIGLLKYSTPDLRYRWLEEGDYLSHGGMIGHELKISQFRVMHPVKLAEWKVDLSGPLGGFGGNFT